MAPIDAEDRVGAFTVLVRVFARLFVVMCVLVAIVAVAGYATGWITIASDPAHQTTTIEIDRGEAREEAREVANEGRELARDLGDAIRRIGEPDENETPRTAAEDVDVEVNVR